MSQDVEPRDPIEEQWVVHGFSSDRTLEWRKAGAFDPKKTKEMEEAGIEPSDVIRFVTSPHSVVSYTGHSIAYLYCNNDLSIEDVQKLINKERK